MKSNRKFKLPMLNFLTNVKDNGVKVTVIAVLLSAVTLNVGFTEEDPKDAFSTVYHLYNGTQYLGVVEQQKQIDKVIEDKQLQANAQYEDLTIEAGANITVVPEQVFTVATNDKEALQNLQQAITIEADAYALQIGGKEVAYLKDKAAYEEALRLLKLKYVSEQELAAFEADTNTVPLSEHNQTRIADISFTAQVTGAAKKVAPTEILTPAQAVELMTAGTLEKEVYTIKSGDMLQTIATAHNLTLAELKALNPGVTESSLLSIDQKLNVTVTKPLIAVKVVMEKYRVETIDFQKTTKEEPAMLKGESKLTQQGKDGQKQVLYTITSENGTRTAKSVASETVTTPAVDEITVVGTKVIPSRGTGTFTWPAVGGYISSHMGDRFDGFHRGLDIAGPSDRAIKATDNGVVSAAGWEGTYGNRIVIDHNNGYKTLYAHLSSIDVKVGQVVGQGTQIGVMGSTGNSTGLHLHFEVQSNGALIDPMSVLK